jgi:hypothetical protein
LLLQLDELGGHKVKKIIGRTPQGDFQFSDGDILADTVFRFKGRSANCVVLSEVDFEVLDDNSKRRLFVGMTRARLRLGLICTPHSEQLLMAQTDE